MRFLSQSLTWLTVAGLLILAGNLSALTTDGSSSAEAAAEVLDSPHVAREVAADPTNDALTKVVTSPKFKCKPVSVLYGPQSVSQKDKIDLMCPSGHFVTSAQCSVAGPPVLNTLASQLPPGQTSWAIYLILNGNGFARGVHCEMLTGKVMASAMCCANY